MTDSAFNSSAFNLKWPGAANNWNLYSSYGEYELDEDAPTYWKSAANAQWIDIVNTSWEIGDPCGDGQMAKIHRSLHKFFTFLKGIKKYGDLYINGTISKVQNLQNTIKATTAAIASVLRVVIQRFRNWLLNHIKALIQNAIENLLPNWARQIKKGIVAQILDQIFCGIKKIIKGLVDLVGDFLYSLIGQVINTPFCAAERWANALINRLVSDIDKALGPIFDTINDILGGVAKIYGSVASAINKILGFQGFLCGEPNCPDIKEFKLGPWGGPSPAQVDAFNNFNFGISPNFPGEITKGANDALDDFFGEDSQTSVSPGNCYTGSFECGIPQIVLFGGGGSGAAAQVVINKIGQVIGSNLLSGGSGYTSTPFVSVEDPAGCGNNASASAVLGDSGDNIGKVVAIKINNPGSQYSSGFSGGSPIINTFVGSPNPAVPGGTINLSWNVSNADIVSMDMPGYDVLPLIGNASFPISPDIYFGPGETTTTQQFTLTAKKTNKNSQTQEVSKTFILTIKKDKNADEEGPNINTPVIDSFTASPGTVGEGEIFTLSWQTSNITNVTLNTPGYESLPEDGAVSLVAPSDLQFPPDGSNAILEYTLTAKNANALTEFNKESPIKEVSSTIQIFVTPKGSDSTGAGDDPTDGNSTGTGDGTDGLVGSGDGGSPNDGIAVIDDIDIINTGIGYTSGDTVSISDGDGSDIGFEINPSGQIVGLNVNEGGYGFTTIPNLTINSSTGVGAEFRVNLKFIPLNDFLEDQRQKELGFVIDPNKLVQVIDCVSQ